MSVVSQIAKRGVDEAREDIVMEKGLLVHGLDFGVEDVGFRDHESKSKRPDSPTAATN